MKSTVLYYKGGTLSEERFRNMTPPQWLFHYYEVTKFVRKEHARMDNLVKVLIDHLKVLWLTTDFKIGKKLLETENQSKIKQGEYEAVGKKFEEEWNKIMENAPKTISLTALTPQRKHVLPTFSKEQLRRRILGIQITDPDIPKEE